MATERTAALKYQKQNTVKESRLAKGQHPKTGVRVEDARELEQLRADWELKKPVSKNPKDKVEKEK